MVALALVVYPFDGVPIQHILPNIGLAPGNVFIETNDHPRQTGQ